MQMLPFVAANKLAVLHLREGGTLFWFPFQHVQHELLHMIRDSTQRRRKWIHENSFLPGIVDDLPGRVVAVSKSFDFKSHDFGVISYEIPWHFVCEQSIECRAHRIDVARLGIVRPPTVFRRKARVIHFWCHVQ